MTSCIPACWTANRWNKVCMSEETKFGFSGQYAKHYVAENYPCMSPCQNMVVGALCCVDALKMEDRSQVQCNSGGKNH